MSLHDGIDTVAIVSGGVFTETYGASHKSHIANLYASRGYMEDAPNTLIKIINIVMSYFRRRNV
jgi:hypothetical protein